jgi:flagellar basal-body rod modification protein FlgD
MRQGAESDLAKTGGVKENGAAAGDFQKAYGDQAIGDVLNKISDPNWQDPSKKVRAVGNNSLDKDAFFKLMLTQMKNQDPTNPMQSHEMAAQLAQFSSLEQLNNIGKGIEGLNQTQAGQGNFGALSFIGKIVSGDASKITRATGDTEHGFNFVIGADAQKTKVIVKDATGKTVRELEPGALKKGANSIKWNGLTTEGLPARPGEYKFSVEATGNGGQKVYAKSSFEGRISGVDFSPTGPMVIVNGQSIKLSDVKKIQDPGIVESQQNRTSATPLGVGQLKQAPGISAPILPPAPEEQTSNLDSIPMAGPLLAKLQKETKE